MGDREQLIAHSKKNWKVRERVQGRHVGNVFYFLKPSPPSVG